MPEFDRPVVLQLQADELIQWRDHRPMWLSVVRGRVWVTRAHDPDDHFLDPGQAMRLEADAQAIVGAEGGAAQVSLSPSPSRGAHMLPQLLTFLRRLTTIRAWIFPRTS